MIQPIHPRRRDRPRRPDPARHYVLRLYIAGTTPRSSRAVANLKRLCEEHLDGAYDLQIIDVYQQPRLASREQILAAPTLVKKLPLPLRRLIGDLSDTRRTLIALDLCPPRLSTRFPA